MSTRDVNFSFIRLIQIDLIYSVNMVCTQQARTPHVNGCIIILARVVSPEISRNFLRKISRNLFQSSGNLPRKILDNRFRSFKNTELNFRRYNFIKNSAIQKHCFCNKNTFCGTRYLSHCLTLLTTNYSVSKIVMLVATGPTFISARTYTTVTTSLRYVTLRYRTL